MDTEAQLAIDIAKWKLIRSYHSKPMPLELSTRILDFIHANVVKRDKEWGVTNIMVNKLKMFNHTKGVSTSYKNLCKRLNAEPIALRQRSIRKVQDTPTLPKGKYINPEIQRHLDIAKALMEEEETKLAIYYEMKEVMESRIAS